MKLISTAVYRIPKICKIETKHIILSISNDKETKVEIFHAEKTPTREHRFPVVTES